MSAWPPYPAPASGSRHVPRSPSSREGPIYAAPVVVDVEADDEPTMELRPWTVICVAGWECFVAGSSQVSTLVDHETRGQG